MPDRVVVFIDAQNVYRGARNAFFGDKGLHPLGQIDPIAVAELICGRGLAADSRVLHEVRIYTGRPDSTRDPRAYGPHMRQCAAWEKSGVVVVPRALRYPFDWPRQKAEEKGIDVALAVDFIAGAIEDAWDVGVIFSTDTDLRPALEYVASKFPVRPRAEVAAWKSPVANRQLTIRGPRRIWCHFLDRSDYDSVCDERDYNQS
ncbi:MAG: NYN domain-containing protein [Dehalococcoidia bacterium]